MRRRRLSPDQPQAWINRARSDLAIAQSEIPEAYREDLCYHAQQCAEKAMKAMLLKHTGGFPYIHDLAELANRIMTAGMSVPDGVLEAVSLTQYAVEGRYPGPNEPVSETEWQDAIRMAKTVLSWVATSISPKRKVLRKSSRGIPSKRK